MIGFKSLKVFRGIERKDKSNSVYLLNETIKSL